MTGGAWTPRFDPGEVGREGEDVSLVPGETVRAAATDAFFRRVVEGMRCGVMTIDRDGLVVTVNDIARQILDLDGPVEPGRPVEDVLARHPRLAEVLRASLEMSHLPNRAEMEIRSREDDGRTIGFTVSTIPGDDGPEGIALFFKDLTQVERQEEQERLRDRLAALGQMAASLAHEIRNPLASIDVTATLLRRKLQDRDEERRLVEKIAGEVARVGRTVTHALEFARAIRLERKLQALPPLLDAAIEEALARCDAKGVTVVRRYDPAAPPVAVDGNHLRQVFVNLLVNACEAMHNEGRVTVSVRAVARPGCVPGAVEAEIRDTGPGIDPEVLEKVFYPFVTTKREGSGIGLALARKIVECHHGIIDVRSRPGEGAAFIVRLPAGDPAGAGGPGSGVE